MGIEQVLIPVTLYFIFRLWHSWVHDRLNRRREDEVQALKPDRLWYSDGSGPESGHRPGDQD